jgi:hypothetical protein
MTISMTWSMLVALIVRLIYVEPCKHNRNLIHFLPAPPVGSTA